MTKTNQNSNNNVNTKKKQGLMRKMTDKEPKTKDNDTNSAGD